MHRTRQINIYQGEQRWYIADSIHLPFVTQEITIDETIENLREALFLHSEGDNIKELGFSQDAPVVITMEIDPVHIQSNAEERDEPRRTYMAFSKKAFLGLGGGKE